MRFSIVYLLPAAYCLLAVCISCKQKTNYSGEIARLDSAVVKLIEAENTFTALDTVSLQASSRLFQEKLHTIRDRISGDTVKKITAQFLSYACEQEGNLANLIENKRYFARAIAEGRQRISDLKHDLTEDLIEKNKSAGYIVNELNASQKICETMNQSIEKAKSAAAKLDSMKTRIIFIADSLQSK